MSFGGRRQGHGPTIGDLREILNPGWTPPVNPYDEVYPGIYIGDSTTALSLRLLRSEGISHILNGAYACPSCLVRKNCGGCVVTNGTFYSPDGITFIGIQAHDERRFPIFRRFQESSDFIASALQNGARNVEVLKSLGITVILNVAQGTNPNRYVDTNPEYYSALRFECEFLGIPAMDIMAYQLHPFFLASADFIEDALSNAKGKVLVHCREGVSRSPTLVIAYLMMKKDMTAIEAVKAIRAKRAIYPNDGFLEQLCDLDLRLRGERSFRGD